MISITTHVSGSTIAENMVDDMEEAAQFFPEFADRLGAGDIMELEDFLNDVSLNEFQKANFIVLGKLLIKIGKAK